MNRKWMATVWILAGAIALTVGCGPKDVPPVAPPPPPPPPVEEPEEVTPPPAPPVVDDEVDIEDLEIEAINQMIIKEGLMNDVYYEFDKYDLGAEARASLQKNAAFMNEHSSFVFAVEGHCDERGTNEYNLALGERRANAASDYLGSLGIGGSRMRTVSYGEERPTCGEHNEGCWWQNRRAHFVVVGK